MKTIHLLRHAKSSWADSTLPDMDRPLKTRGKQAALLMIEPLWKAGCRFDHVFCSPAKRARSTIRRMSKALKGEGIYWKVDPALYTFSADELLDWLRALDDGMDEVMVVGHNPAITDLANRLGDRDIENVPTCGYVQLLSDIKSWQKLKPGTAHTKEFLFPKMIDFDDSK